MALKGTAAFCSAALVFGLLVATGACSSTSSDDSSNGDGGSLGDANDPTGDASKLVAKDAGKDAAVPCGRDTTKCPDGAKCAGSLDCTGGICRSDVCSSPSPADGMMDGNETDVDCGGDKAPACGDGKKCKIGDDCIDEVCTLGVCAAPTCTDNVQNGLETGKDCGGGTCPLCADGAGCKNGMTDCMSGVCTGAKCEASACDDKVKNGSETDVDCGGTCPGKCTVGEGCKVTADCSNLICDSGGTKKCLPPSSTDGLKNGTETDTDCGGGAPTNAPKCPVNKTCSIHTDCLSDGCTYLNKCAVAPSCAQHYGGDTCGAGETGTGAKGGENHESCCASLTLPGLTTQIDKYEITAGRMREFLSRVNNDVYDWYQAWKIANPTKVASSGIATSSEQYLPTGLATPMIPNFQYNYSTDGNPKDGVTQATGHTMGVYDHLGNTVFFADRPSDFQGCYIGSTEYADGHPTFWFDADTQNTYWGAGPRGLSQAALDEKSLNCVTQLLVAAFCAWDGGRLPTYQELSGNPGGNGTDSSAWGSGSYPWGNSPAYTDTWTTVVPGRVLAFADTQLNGNPTQQSNIWDVLMPINDGTGHANLLGPTYNTTNWNPFYPVIPSGLRYYWPQMSVGNCGATDGTYSTTCPGKAGQTCPTNCGWGQNDEAYEIAAPGRFVNDRHTPSNIANPGPLDGFFDLTANMMEVTSNGGGSDDANHDSLPGTYWVGGSFEGHGVNTGANHVTFNFNILTKYGKQGGRCAR